MCTGGRWPGSMRLQDARSACVSLLHPWKGSSNALTARIHATEERVAAYPDAVITACAKRVRPFAGTKHERARRVLRETPAAAAARRVAAERDSRATRRRERPGGGVGTAAR